MSEATVHPMLASTTVTEEVRDLAHEAREFYDRHHVTVGVSVVLLISTLLQRGLIRRELSRLRFSVEVFDPDREIPSDYVWAGED